VLKAPQRITHFARLRDVDESVRIFCDVARGLGARLGPLLFQLPPNFKKDPPARRRPLYGAAELRMAWEFRHDSWFADDVYERLRGATLPWPSSRTTTRRRPPGHRDWGYFRLRAVDYTDARLEAWVKTIRGVGAGLARRLRVLQARGARDRARAGATARNSARDLILSQPDIVSVREEARDARSADPETVRW